MRNFFAWVRSLFETAVNWIFEKLGQKPPFEAPDEPEGPGGPVVAYYGCPNSERTAALQLGRKQVK